MKDNIFNRNGHTFWPSIMDEFLACPSFPKKNVAIAGVREIFTSFTGEFKSAYINLLLAANLWVPCGNRR